MPSRRRKPPNRQRSSEAESVRQIDEQRVANRQRRGMDVPDMTGRRKRTDIGGELRIDQFIFEVV